MSKKLECIQNLKSKLAEMKKQLSRLQNNTHDAKQYKFQTDKSWMNKTSYISGNQNYFTQGILTKSPSWKNPTFWGTNPISGKQNYKSTTSKWKSSRNIKKQLSPSAKQLKMFCDETYYDHSKKLQKPSSKQSSKQSLFEKNQHIKSHKNMTSYGWQQKQTPRFEKIKTYDHPPTDPILNPEKQVQKGKRIVTQPTLSPNTNLVQNPKSNPSLYLFKDKVTILSPKASNNKNLSPNVKQLLSSSLEQKNASPKRNVCKKHFTKYFKQTYQCKWN